MTVGSRPFPNGGGRRNTRSPTTSRSYLGTCCPPAMNDAVSMPRRLWRDLMSDLRTRGEGRRESGAFLLAPPGADRVAAHVCYDDLDPCALDTGIIVFHGCGYVPLWQLCEARQLRVVADVHTHPTNWTEQ